MPLGKYRAPIWELGDYLKVEFGPQSGRVGRVISIESFDTGTAPIYTLKDIGRQYEFNLDLYVKGVSKK